MAWAVVAAVWWMIIDVLFFWHRKLLAWFTSRSPTSLWLSILRTSSTYEDWEEAALHLDNLLGLDLWRNNPTSRHYDYRLIHERLLQLNTARDAGNVPALVNLLRSGLVRNLGNITAPKLYNRSFAGTKFLIEEYITRVAEAIEDISSLPTSSGGANGSDGDGGAASFDWRDGSGGLGGWAAAGMSTQMKLDFVHDTRQAFGRSTLVLQGGAIFGLCHVGVVKALFLRGLLPRIITGTATGALVAALVAIHNEEELPGVLRGDGIDLTAFAGKTNGETSGESFSTRWRTLKRRVTRFWRDGYILDVKVLEECVKANVGEMTFEEAYNRSKRVLNITVGTNGQGGAPTLLNYLTAPNVLIWTAAVASNASTSSLYGHRETTILCKDAYGRIVPWKEVDAVDDFHTWARASYSDHASPLQRVAELFNVNHFIVSQARPYLIPFLQSDMHGPSVLETHNKTAAATSFLARMVGLEVRHRLQQLDTLHVLPSSVRRFLVDESVPGTSMTLVPEVTAGDFVRLLETPTRDTLEYWILRGERSVWPAVAALRIRCAVETELDRAYQQARRLRAGGLRRKSSAGLTLPAAVEKERRERGLGP